MYALQQDEITDDTTPLIPLEPEAFSRRTKLALYDFGRHATLYILNHLTSTVGLKELALEINHNKDDKGTDSSVDEFYNSMLIPAICVRTPRLTHLSIRPMLDDKSYVEIDGAALELLASLRLKSLTLAKSRAHVRHLAKLFPRVQTFRWPDQSVTLSQLGQFVIHYQLEHLSMKLDLSPPHIIEPLRDRAMPPVFPCVPESDYGNLNQLSQAETQKLL
ncbi:hypothetical protein FRC11_013843, partial [Ceratobasidium sp. 423]